MRARIAAICLLALAMVTYVTPALAANSLAVPQCGTPPCEAAIEGNYGLKVTLDGSNTNAYVESDHPVNETHMLWRFWVQPAATLNTGMGQQTAFRFARTNNADVGGEGQNVIHFLRRGVNDGSGRATYRLNTWVKDGDGSWKFVGGFFLTNGNGLAARQIEVEWTRDSGSGDGSITVTRVDNSATASRTGLTNATHDIDKFRIGIFIGGNPSAATGDYHFDSYESYR
jgi:hypothetical protein